MRFPKNNPISWLLFIFVLVGLACTQTEATLPPPAPTGADSRAIEAAVATIQAANGTTPIQADGSAVLGAEPGLQTTLVGLYKNVNVSVVHIISSFGSGSGFVYDSSGHIVTNNHVVEGAEQFEVVFGNGERSIANVVGTDVDSDLAVIRAVDLPASATPLVLGDSSQIEVGQVVVAIGNPFGEQSSMSMGIISGLGRSLASQRPGFSLPQVIQTDAPINPGNSGGPLFNLNGQVVGVNSAIRSTTGVNSGVGFSIPINAVRRIVPSLISTGRYAYPYLGVGVLPQGIDLATKEQLGLSQTTGAYLTDIQPNSPAERAGLIGQRGPGGDLIIAINGQAVLEFNDLLSYLVFETEVGSSVDLLVLRNGREQVITVVLGERP
jgi:2-alkenal reductase